MESKYYLVEVKCGHVGRNYYIIKTLGVKAETKKEAASIARWLPRVKHHVKDAVQEVREVSKEEFADLIEINGQDMYFQCTCKQEQLLYCGPSENRIKNIEYDDEIDDIDRKLNREKKHQNLMKRLKYQN